MRFGLRILRPVLTIVFGWSLLKSIDLLARHQSLDRLLFESADMTWIFYALLLALAVCQATALSWIWRRFRRGYLFAFGAIALNLVETAIATAIAVRDTEVAKQAFIASRQSRGLSVRQEVVDLMDNPTTHLVSLAAVVLLGLLWCALIALLIRANKRQPESDPQH